MPAWELQNSAFSDPGKQELKNLSVLAPNSRRSPQREFECVPFARPARRLVVSATFSSQSSGSLVRPRPRGSGRPGGRLKSVRQLAGRLSDDSRLATGRCLRESAVRSNPKNRRVLPDTKPDVQS